MTALRPCGGAILVALAVACGSDDTGSRSQMPGDPGAMPFTGGDTTVGPNAGPLVPGETTPTATPGCGPINDWSLCQQPAPPGSVMPPPFAAYSGGQCPALVEWPERNVIASSGRQREFLLAVPDNACPGEIFPVGFMWHWISGEASDLMDRDAMQQIVNEERIIAIVPEAVGAEVFGQNTTWPFDVTQTPERMEEEFRFFDDMLACVAQQFPVNAACVGTAGVSAGGLFNSQLMQGRGHVLASGVTLSGGTGNLVHSWLGSAHRMPALVLWGGPQDALPPPPNALFSFDETSRDFEFGLQRDGHFLVECVHNCGHVPPILEPGPNGEPALAPVYEFLLAHPYWLADGDSPYLQTGLPPTYPSWCGIGVGSAPPANVSNCTALF